MAQGKICCVWDMTIADGLFSVVQLKTLMKEHCKKWCFQLEEGKETGYKHYQCRVNFKSKQRITSIVKIFVGAHVSPTSTVNRDNMFYVTKDESRVAGPWKDDDPYIPRQVREIAKLRPWQEGVISLSKVWDTRTINVIIDCVGNIGKTTLCSYMCVHRLGTMIPFANDFKDIMRGVMDRPKLGCYLIDLPRAISKDRLYQLYGGIEMVKSGYAYDDRYKFQEEWFDCPAIFVFTNVVPDAALLSRDRWKLWEVVDNELVKYGVENPPPAAPPSEVGGIVGL